MTSSDSLDSNFGSVPFIISSLNLLYFKLTLINCKILSLKCKDGE